MNPIVTDPSPLVLTAVNGGKIVCGLSWDPNIDATMKDRIKNAATGVNTETYDLDLSVYCYDENKSLMDYITGEEGEMIDRSQRIVHSGDCRHGEEDGDDEYATFDLANLPDYIKHIVVLAEVGSAHSFYDVANPYIRVADENTNQNLDDLKIDEEADGEYSACVYVTFSRHDDGSWLLYRNNYFIDHERIESWPDFLSQFIAS